MVPIANVQDFCSWYRLTREHRKYEHDDPAKVMRLYFEDLIYHYDETVDQICKLLNLDRSLHVSPKTKLIPERSIANTQMWKRYPDEEENIKHIETQLSEYCYKRFT